MQVSGQDAIDEMSDYMKPTGKPTIRLWDSLAGMNRQIGNELTGKSSFHDLTSEQRKNIRRDIYLFSESMLKLIKKKEVTDPAEVSAMSSLAKKMSNETKYIPTWVKFAVALALGLGTMIGWKRIVVTVGEKIGKTHLTYAQGASAEIVAMGTILTADKLGLPVSTTHILSSGVAGTMWANKSGLARRHRPQHPAGLGADVAGMRAARVSAVRRLVLHTVQPVRREVVVGQDGILRPVVNRPRVSGPLLLQSESCA